MKKYATEKSRNNSEQNSKIYPFKAISSDDTGLLDKSFNHKFQRKISELANEYRESYGQRPQKKSVEKKSRSNQLKELLKNRMISFYPQTPNNIPNPHFDHKRKNSLKSPLKSPKKVNSALRKTISLAESSKKSPQNKKKLRMNESFCFKEVEILETKNEIEPANIVIKQRGLSDRTEPKNYPVSKKESLKMDEKKNEMKDGNGAFSLETLEIIRNELLKPRELRNVVMLDSILKDLYYLKKFSPFYRKKILRLCEFYELESGNIIFKQDDIADNVYIILRGAVSIQMKNGKYAIILKTMYDGEHFGDLNIQIRPVKSRKRQATCRCSEKSFLLGIDQTYLQDLLFNKNEKLQFFYFKFLRALFIFENVDDFTVSNFARNVKRIRYKYGETIIHQGDIPKGMHIIFKGSCNVVKESFCTRRIQPSKYNSLLHSPKINAKNGQKDATLKTNDPRVNYLKKYFNYKQINQDEYKYKEQIFYKKLNCGDIFAGYILFFENYPDAEQKYLEEITYSVIADDLIVEIWIFENFLLNFLAKSTLATSFLDLVRSVDLPNEKSEGKVIQKEIEDWHNYKMRLYENRMQENYWSKKTRKNNSYFL